MSWVAKRSHFVKVAAVLLTGVWCHAAPDYTSTSFSADQWAKNTAGYPYLDVKCYSSLPGLSPGGTVEYAGIFGGVDDLTGQRYDIVCNELNHDIYIGNRYTADFYYDYVNMPIHDGSIAVDNGSPLTTQQKQILDGMYAYLGLSQQVVGISVHGAQDLGGVLCDKLTTPTLLRSLSNEQAAACQLFTWELIHEPFDPAHPLANINLTSGNLVWTNVDGSPLSQTIVDEVNAIAGHSLQNQVPEPLAMGAPVLSVAAASLMRWRKRNAKQASRRVLRESL